MDVTDTWPGLIGTCTGAEQSYIGEPLIPRQTSTYHQKPNTVVITGTKACVAHFLHMIILKKFWYIWEKRIFTYIFISELMLKIFIVFFFFYQYYIELLISKYLLFFFQCSCLNSVKEISLCMSCFYSSFIFDAVKIKCVCPLRNKKEYSTDLTGTHFCMMWITSVYGATFHNR